MPFTNRLQPKTTPPVLLMVKLFMVGFVSKNEEESVIEADPPKVIDERSVVAKYPEVLAMSPFTVSKVLPMFNGPLVSSRVLLSTAFV